MPDMDNKYGFTRMTISEFETWIPNQTIARTVNIVQQHHTWSPRYSNFDGNNHFAVQRGMKNHHVGTNGWSDIGQHLSIFPDGKLVTGRSFNRTPACIAGANSGCFCIENVGNFDKGNDQMTAEQADAVVRATAALLKKFGQTVPSKSNIVYHHWFDANGKKLYGKKAVKSCPGTAFFGGNKLEDFESGFLPLVRNAMQGVIVPPAQTTRWVVVTTSRLNIRKGPSTATAKVIGLGPAEYGSILRVYKQQNGWLKISSSKNHWVYGRYTDDVVPVTVNTDESNGRTGPGMQYEVDATFDQGAPLFVYETSGSWSRVSEIHWIYSTLLDPR